VDERMRILSCLRHVRAVTMTKESSVQTNRHDVYDVCNVARRGFESEGRGALVASADCAWVLGVSSAGKFEGEKIRRVTWPKVLVFGHLATSLSVCRP
jgi:hypothetical protein